MSLVRKESYRNVDDFLSHQKEIEKNACAKAGSPWSTDRELSFRFFSDECRKLSEQAVATKAVVRDPKYKKNYKNPADGSFWQMNLRFHPDRTVEFYHNQIAQSIRSAR